MALRDETGTIVLGGEKIPVKAFTLDQLQTAMGHFRDFDRIVAVYDEQTGSGGAFDPGAIKAAADLVSLAIGRPTSEITATADELFVAVGVLKEVAGLVPLMKRLAEMVAAAQTLTGTASTPTS